MWVLVLFFTIPARGNYTNDDLFVLYPEIYGDGTYTTEAQEVSYNRAQAIKREVELGGLLRLAQLTDDTIGRLLSLAIRNLERRGHFETAREIQEEWDFYQGAIVVVVLGRRPIGDFEVWSAWLHETYRKIESKLGNELCRALRISDLFTINASRAVFRPCVHGYAEFHNHLVHDHLYRGLLPVVSYWVSTIGCQVAAAGTAFFLCSPVALLIEFSVDRWVAPFVADRLWGLLCD